MVILKLALNFYFNFFLAAHCYFKDDCKFFG